MENKLYSIFISSTYTDLIMARSKLNELILNMYHFPIGMEMFSASSTDQWTIIRGAIDRSDYYILLIGHRYGSMTTEGISYTEKEYHYAKSTSTPTLVFIKDRNSPTMPSEREDDPIIQKKLDEFIEKVKLDSICDFWQTEEELGKKVSIALSKEFARNPQLGWIRNNSLIAKSKEVTIENAINSYIAEKVGQGLSNKTIEDYKLELNIFSNFFEGKYISEFETKDIKEFLKNRKDNYNITSNKTLEKIRGIVKILFDWLYEEQLVNHNPVTRIKRFKLEKTVTEILTEDELTKLRKACIDLRERAIIEVFLSTGCKLGEVINIQLKDIRWNKSFINITKSQNGDRIVPLNKTAKKHLKNYLNSRNDIEEFMFVTHRRPYRSLNQKTIQDEINKIANRSNIKKSISPKTFRHTFARMHLNEGVPLHIVQSLLGNSSYSNTSETYYRLNENNIGNFIN